MAADTPRVINSRVSDDELWADLESQRARRTAARGQLNDVLVARTKAIKQRAPWLKPGVIAALAQSNVDLAGPEFKQLMTAGAKTKSKKHGWGPIGAITKVGSTAFGGALHLADKALGNVDELAGDIAKPIVRGAALGAQSAWEEAEGLVRNVAAVSPEAAGVGVGAALGSIVPGVGTAIGAGVGGAIGGGLGFLARDEIKGKPNWELQSRGAVALGQRLSGRKVELGHGFLPHPGEAIEKEVKRRETVTVGGHALTPGRLLAAGVVEPGTKPYNMLSGLVDASLALSRYDPTGAVTKVGGNVNRNRKLFTGGEGVLERAGALASHRPDIVPEVADAWWTNATDLRQKLVELQGEDGFHQIRRATKGKLGADITRQLADATTEAEVDGIIRPVLGKHDALRGPLEADFRTFRPFENVRLLKSMPGHTIDPNDPDQAVEMIERWMQNAKASPELVAKHTYAMARAESAPNRLAAAEAAMDATKDLLVEKGWDNSTASRLTRMNEEATAQNRGYWRRVVAGQGTDGVVPGMFEDGGFGPKPHVVAEFLDSAIPLPDARDVRAATSRFSKVFANKAVQVGTSSLDHVQGQIWKRMALLRGAYTVRVIGEEQIRMAASGLDSLVNHPLSLISMRLRDDSKVGRLVERLGLDVGKAQGDLLGEDFSRASDEFDDVLDEHAKALNHEFGGWVEPRRVTPMWGVFKRGEDRYGHAMAEELGKLASSPDVRIIVRNLDDLDGVKAMGWGNGATRVEDAATPLERYRIRLADDASGLRDRDVYDAYVDSIVERVQASTGNNPELLEVLQNGTFKGSKVPRRLTQSKDVMQHLEAISDVLPEEVYGQVTLGERGVGHYWDQATRWMFSNLMGERTNNLSRSPTFRQFYWQRAEELAPYMTPETRGLLAQEARANKLDDVADRVSKIKRAGDLSADDADFIAKGFALDNTRDLLYDMTEKGQFFDATRLVFPFGEAWKELVTRWAKIGTEQPQVLRRAQQVVTGARQSGFFHTNTNGEEVFSYPASEWVSEKLFGVPVPLEGRVAGLSLMTDVLPGVGPVVQVPAGALLPDKPDFDTMRGIIFPFGEVDSSSGVLEAFLPAWVQKFRQTGALSAAGIKRDDGMWNSTVLDVSRYLASTGKYDTSTPDGMSKMLKDASGKAKAVYALRGAAQFFAPTAPTPEWIARDKNGDVLVAQKLVEEYQDQLRGNAEKGIEADPEHATDKMLEKYGDGIFLLLQGKTAEVTPAAPVTKAGADWERAHGDIASRYPNVYGFFAPQGGDLDITAYGRQLSSGKRQRLTPEQAVRLANDRVANAVYQNAKRRVGLSPNAEQRAWLRGLREALVEDYPGFGDHSGIPEKVSTDTLVRDLTAAVGDNRLKGNPVVAPIRKYLIGREKARQAAEAAGFSPDSFKSARSLAPVRAWLRGLGEALVEEDPDFGAAWERVFDRELMDDTLQEEQ